MFKFKQSSFVLPVKSYSGELTHSEPKLVASKTPSPSEAAGFGGAKRSSPIGGAAKGIPRKISKIGYVLIRKSRNKISIG